MTRSGQCWAKKKTAICNGLIVACMSTSIRYAIPGVGTVRAGFDRVRIVSSASVGALKKTLPIEALEEASHLFNITTYKGPNPGLRSVLTIICAGNDAPLRTPVQP